MKVPSLPEDYFSSIDSFGCPPESPFFLPALVRFRFAQGGEDTRRLKDTGHVPAPRATGPLPRPAVHIPQPSLLLPRMAWLEFRRTVASLGFLLIVAAGVTFIFIGSQTMQTIYGTSIYPVTATIVELARGMFSLFMLIIITVYSGQMVWRERDAEMNQLCDVLPIPTWLPYIVKLLALMLVLVVLLGVVMLSGMVIQASHGHFRFEPGLYVRDLFGLQLPNLCLIAVLALVIQIIVNHKYLGHFVMVIYYLASSFAPNFGFEHRLYRYASNPGYTYSDMNGFGHFLGPIMWFDAYWAMFALLLAVIGNLLWPRGLESDIRQRLRLARERFSLRHRVVMVLTMTASVLLGGFIFYNTNILNEYRTRNDRQRRQALYEHTYKERMNIAQPRIESVRVAIDIYPAERTVHANGEFQLRNNSDEEISTLFLSLPREAREVNLSVDGESADFTVDEEHGVYTLTLGEAMAPTATLPLSFDLQYAPRGFRNARLGTRIVHNGTFMSDGFLPHLGYQTRGELTDDSTRRKHGLEPKERMASIDDIDARRNNYICFDADWVDFEATISTSPDQIAVAPGSLQREWEENGRRYFHYKADGPMVCFYSFLSARYEVLRDSWNDVGIEIYYHKGHEYNLDSMVEAIKASLNYFSTNFSPYQHKQIRILEFPQIPVVRSVVP